MARAIVILLGALTLPTASCASTPRLSTADPEAQVVAEAFARALIEDGLEGAKPYLASTAGAEFIERDHEFFLVHEFVITGRARFDEKVGIFGDRDTRCRCLVSRVNETLKTRT